MRHLLQIFAGQTGTKAWKRYLAEHGNTSIGGSNIVRQALLDKQRNMG